MDLYTKEKFVGKGTVQELSAWFQIMTRTQILERQIKDWKIKYDNLSSAKKISEENLNREITNLKKELTVRDRQIDSLVEIIGKLDKKVDELTERVSELTKENVQLRETISIQNDQITKLKSRIDKDSNNSSKPPSTDGFRKTVRNNREKSDKKIGGQPGHKGHGLSLFTDPTEVIERKVHVCDCGGEMEIGAAYEAKQHVDINITLSIKVIAFLTKNNYSPTHISLHRVCYREFRSFLVATNQMYSMKKAINWLDSNKSEWNKPRYLGYLHCLKQLEDVYQANEIQPEHLSSQHSAYKQLMPSLMWELDTYLEYCKSTDTFGYIEQKRFICSRFLLYLQEHDIRSISEISYTLMLRFHEKDFHRTQKSKDVYEGCIRKLLRYYAQAGKCSIGYSLILNKLLIHQVIFLSDMSDDHVKEIDSLRRESLHLPPAEFWDACRGFQSIIEKYRYAKTMQTCSLHTLTLLFVFLDMHNLGYTPEIAWLWYEEVNPLLKTNWAMSRRVLKLFEQFTQEGDIAPQTTYTYKPIGFDQLPDWCKEPLSSFLKLKIHESMAKSTITMYRSANTRFCFFLVKKV